MELYERFQGNIVLHGSIRLFPIYERITTVVERVFARQLSNIAARLSNLKVNGDFRRFVVNRMGSTGSTWLAKLLNSHRDVYCSQEGVVTRVYPATQCTGDDVLRFIEYFAWDTKHEAYQAVGDVGSVWAGHLECLPMFSTAVLVRHSARLLNTRLKVYPRDQSFSAIPTESRVCIQEIWGIDLDDYQPIDQIFLHDVFTFASQIRFLGDADLVIRIEDMPDVECCQKTLKALTGLDYDRALVEHAIRNHVNCRTDGPAEISEIVAEFSPRQREWYRTMLSEIVPHFGYQLFEEPDESSLASADRAGACSSRRRRV